MSRPFPGICDTERYPSRLNVPYRTVSTPAGTTLVDKGQIIPDTGRDQTESAIGDPETSGTRFDVIEWPISQMTLDLTGKLIFGTVEDNKRLRPGEGGFALQTDVYRLFDSGSFVAPLAIAIGTIRRA